MHDTYTACLEDFISFVQKAKQRYGISFSDTILSYSFINEFPIAGDSFARLLDSESLALLLSGPENTGELFGSGAVYVVASNSVEHFHDLRNGIKNMPKLFEEHNGTGNPPLFFGAMKFASNENDPLWSEFKDSYWFIPSLIMRTINNQTIVTINTYVGEEFDLSHITKRFESYLDKLERITENHDTTELPYVIDSKGCGEDDKNRWRWLVQETKEYIKEKKVSKLVVARREEYVLSSIPTISDVVTTLAEQNPLATVYAFKKRDSVFLGATPETLLQVKQNVFYTEAIAGTQPRGAQSEEDSRNEATLLGSEKEQLEHKIVSDYILSQLEPLVDNLKKGSSPVVKKFSRIQHLQTTFNGDLKSNSSSLQVLEALFPTPAVCGLPKDNAYDLIKELEFTGRGLFAGTLGWFNIYNDCNMIVSLRCGLLQGNKLYSFAGCGIVEGSDPDQEFEETQLKFRTIRSVFEHGKNQ